MNMTIIKAVRFCKITDDEWIYFTDGKHRRPPFRLCFSVKKFANILICLFLYFTLDHFILWMNSQTTNGFSPFLPKIMKICARERIGFEYVG